MRAPVCVICEESIEPGEPFKPVMAYAVAEDKALKRTHAAGEVYRLVNRGVHYSCELQAIRDEVFAEEDDAESFDLRVTLHKLMKKATRAIDLLDELL
jgi:hypothetical protein